MSETWCLRHVTLPAAGRQGESFLMFRYGLLTMAKTWSEDHVRTKQFSLLPASRRADLLLLD